MLQALLVVFGIVVACLLIGYVAGIIARAREWMHDDAGESWRWKW